LEGLSNKVLAAENHMVLPDEKLLAEELARTRRAWEARHLPEQGADCVFRGSWTRVSREGGQVFRAKLDSRSAATQGFSVFTLTAGFRSN
jgi:hypothetical protein